MLANSKKQRVLETTRLVDGQGGMECTQPDYGRVNPERETRSAWRKDTSSRVCYRTPASWQKLFEATVVLRITSIGC